jgi:hypothetical protein
LPLFFFFLCVFCSVFFFCFCYLPLFLCSALLVAVERKSTGGASGLKVAGGGSSSSPFYSSPGFLSLGSVLFLFSLSGSAALAALMVAEWRCLMVVAEWLCS